MELNRLNTFNKHCIFFFYILCKYNFIYFIHGEHHKSLNESTAGPKNYNLFVTKTLDVHCTNFWPKLPLTARIKFNHFVAFGQNKNVN